MQSQRLRNGVYERKIRHARGNDVANIDADEVPISQHATVFDAADLDEDEKDYRDEEEEGREERPYLAGAGSTLDLSFGEIGDDCRARVGGCSRGVAAAATKDAHCVVVYLECEPQAQSTGNQSGQQRQQTGNNCSIRESRTENEMQAWLTRCTRRAAVMRVEVLRRRRSHCGYDISVVWLFFPFCGGVIPSQRPAISTYNMARTLLKGQQLGGKRPALDAGSAVR